MASRLREGGHPIVLAEHEQRLETLGIDVLRPPDYDRAIGAAVRAHDPYQKTIGTWLIRRLSPDSNPIEISKLPSVRDELVLLRAMGSEAANVHLGTRRAARAILADLRRRSPGWLVTAAKIMAKATRHDWKDYASARGHRPAKAA